MMIKEGNCNTTLREAAEEAAGRREQCRGGAAVVTLGVFAGGREAEWDRWHMPEAGTAEIFISRQTDGISGYLGSDAGL